ncbi:sterol desaturase family protein [uncultured Roseobacter sp.]|uniref:sterol desaturase family protein n=1 Tax=uncultured Roseobacter sp. TaxID=114847 RepID=UPI00261710A6|nr:sterol desaturase family protein [uncultured Roseobacter sp.]
MIGTWFKMAPPVSHVLLALITVAFLLPAAPTMQKTDAGWMLQVAAINFGWSVLLGGALHLYLYVFAAQETRLKFDIRPMEKSSRFTFGNQVWDNIFWSLGSSVVLWTLWTILYFHAAANGWVPTLTGIGQSPVWFVLFFFVIRFWQSFHFYWIHRLIHMPLLFRHVHSLHHRNVNVGPWSGLAMHPVEGFLYFSGILIHFVLPSHPIHVIFHMFSLGLGALYSHSGFEKILFGNTADMKAGSFHHQLHHRYFECNYGSEEMPLDRWFGSFHDGTEAATRRIRARKKLIFAPRQKHP